MKVTPTSAMTELAHRSSNGIDVTLLWNRSTNRVCVAVHDVRHETDFTFDIDGRHALDAFRHPFAYAGHEHQAPGASTERRAA